MIQVHLTIMIIPWENWLGDGWNLLKIQLGTVFVSLDLLARLVLIDHDGLYSGQYRHENGKEPELRLNLSLESKLSKRVRTSVGIASLKWRYFKCFCKMLLSQWWKFRLEHFINSRQNNGTTEKYESLVVGPLGVKQWLCYMAYALVSV